MRTSIFIPALMILLAGLQDASAQDTLARIVTRYITVKKAKKDELLPGKAGFSGVRFIDNRSDTTSIDSRFDGGELHKVKLHKVNFRGGLSSINEYVNANYRKDFGKDGDSLLVMVNDFRISAISHSFDNHRPYRLVGLKLSLAYKHRDQVTVLGTYDTLMAFSLGSFTGTGYEGSIKKSIKAMLLRAGDLAKNSRASPERLTEEQFTTRYAQMNKFDYPILRDSSLKKGVYLNYLQFVANSPLQEPDSSLDSSPEYEPIIRCGVSGNGGIPGKVDSNTIWGYCDGRTVYVNTGGSPVVFYPLVMNGDHFDLTAIVGKDPKIAHDGTAMTIVKIVAVVVVIGALCLILRNSSNSHSHASPNLGSGFGSGGSSTAANLFSAPQTTVDNGKKKYSVSATRINMETGKLEF